jgi:putative transposase
MRTSVLPQPTEQAKNPSFVCELPLVLAGADERVLRVRFDVARQTYNACLSEALRRLDLMRQSREYQAARKLPRGKKGSRAAKVRAAAFRKVNRRFGFREYGLHSWATEHISHQWLGEHLDSNTIQKLATRAFRAAQQHAFGRRGRPRFKGRNQLDSVEGKTNASGIRWRDDHVEWLGLNLRAIIDPRDPVIAHGLSSPIKFVRLVRRRLNGKTRYWVQLVCEGLPHRKEKNTIGTGRVGIDPGPRTFGIAGENWGVLVDLATPLKRTRKEIRRLQRQIDRQRRASNPDNYLPDGRIRPGPKTWHISKRQRQNEIRLAELQRKAAAHRKSLHGRLANALLRLGDDIRIEKNSYRSFQRNYGHSVGIAAPAGFVTHLKRKAANAGARARDLPARLRMSQLCHGCGGIEKKPLSLRIHECECGVGPVQRDVYSGWLATTAVPGPDGPDDWRLDANRAQEAWSGAEQRLPAASRPVSVQAFAAWAKKAARGSRLTARLPLGGTERLAGKAVAMVDEARDVVGVLHTQVPSVVPDCQEPGKVNRVSATRTPGL